MKQIFSILVLSIVLIACKSTKTLSSNASLAGEWELNYISGPRIAFEGLYPNRKPGIRFSPETKDQVSGNTSCNSFSGKVKLDGNTISFNEPLAMTKMFCEGGGETTFVEMLKKVNRYAVSGDTLSFMIDDVAVMRFMRK